MNPGREERSSAVPAGTLITVRDPNHSTYARLVGGWNIVEALWMLGVGRRTHEARRINRAWMAVCVYYTFVSTFAGDFYTVLSIT
jgi:hypothetical protein